MLARARPQGRWKAPRVEKKAGGKKDGEALMVVLVAVARCAACCVGWQPAATQRVDCCSRPRERSGQNRRCSAPQCCWASQKSLLLATAHAHAHAHRTQPQAHNPSPTHQRKEQRRLRSVELCSVRFGGWSGRSCWRSPCSLLLLLLLQLVVLAAEVRRPVEAHVDGVDDQADNRDRDPKQPNVARCSGLQSKTKTEQ